MPILSPPVPTHARKPSAAPKLAEKPVAKERLQDIQVEKVESFDQRQLLRDLTFALQGISSENFGFQSNDDPSMCVLQLPHTLSPSIIAMLHTLGEPALLYHNLVALTRSDTSLQGLFGQSLRAAIGNELRSYLTVLATLEGRIRAALASSNSDDSGVDEVVGRTVTLRRCVIWMREPTNGLRLLSLVAEQSASKSIPAALQQP
jgi:gamma-tubulin complex component 3